MKNIFIVDEDAEVLFMVREMLCYEGFNATSAYGKDKLLTQIRNFKPDLILIGGIAECWDACNICKIIRDNQLYSKLPIILMSSNSRVKALKHLKIFTGFVSKPIDIDQLVKYVKMMLYYLTI